MGNLFSKKTDKVDLQQLFEESQAQLLAAQKGEFQYESKCPIKDELLQKIIDNFNEINALRDEYESRLQQRYETLLQMNKVGIWEIDLESTQYDDPKNRVMLSPELQKLLGYRPGELKNDLNELLKITHPDYKEAMHNMMVAHLKDFSGNTPFDMIHLMQFKDRNYRWVRTYGYAVRRPDGTPYRMIAAIADIHDVMMKHNELKDYVTRYDLINEVLEEAPWDIDIIDGDPNNADNVWWWSDQFRHMLGYQDENDFPNDMTSLANSIHPDDSEAAFAAFFAHVNDKTGKTPFSTEYRLRLKSGEYR